LDDTGDRQFEYGLTIFFASIKPSSRSLDPWDQQPVQTLAPYSWPKPDPNSSNGLQSEYPKPRWGAVSTRLAIHCLDWGVYTGK